MAIAARYRPRVPARSRSVRLSGGVRYRLHAWGDAQAPLLVCLHGWGDTGASFQFIADELADRFHLLAPDWRGFGDSDRAAEGYWFPDYLADLDELLDVLSPKRPVALMGHSMGGNIAGLYAGVRPERVSALVLLEGLGLAESDPDDAPARYRRWLDQRRRPSRFRSFAGFEALAEAVRERAPRLAPERARFIAEGWGRLADDGGVVPKADPRHKWVNPVLYRRAEAMACWRRTTAPVLALVGRASQWFERYATGPWLEELRRAYRRIELEVIDDAGHMLHLEQPEAVARAVAAFLATTARERGPGGRCATQPASGRSR